jgi:hypothetical protein
MYLLDPIARPEVAEQAPETNVENVSVFVELTSGTAFLSRSTVAALVALRCLRVLRSLVCGWASDSRQCLVRLYAVRAPRRGPDRR